MLWRITGILLVSAGGWFSTYSWLSSARSPMLIGYGLLCLTAGAMAVVAGFLPRKGPPRYIPAQKTTPIRALLEALEDENWYSRYLATHVLRDMGASARQAVPRLLGLLEDPHEWVREAAAQAIESIDAQVKVSSKASPSRGGESQRPAATSQGQGR